MKKSEYIQRSEYFYGQKISDYGLENNRVDYRTLAKSFDAVMNNYIFDETSAAGLGYWEQVNGFIDNSDELDEIDERIEQLEAERDEADDARADEIDDEIDELNAQRDELEAEQDNPGEIFQWFIIDDRGAEILQELTDEIVFYNEAIDCYLWGVTHWGTAWDYVLTDIVIDLSEEAAK